ncbi:hypothetical protein [Ruegeria arenilitoris]|uniref:hypothetical protein n=1 Tax=Ruegeria arenilitoris TaxID=1173585 RepID=UPI00147B4721|nr:hypothetical protein [Ruegeria arenilitoris]
MTDKKTLTYFKTELDPDGVYRLDLFDVPLGDEEALREAVEAMQLNLSEMTDRAAQPHRASAKAAQRKAEKFTAACAIVDAPEMADLPWPDVLDKVSETVDLSIRLEERLLRYRKARELGADPDTAAWASEIGNFRKFKQVLKALPRNRR